MGALTALFAATIAVAQNDIKKVLAYSTVSQLGYMFLAVGIGAYIAAIFHMITAFFKALLFLGSGSVIHGMHHDQDMRHYGGLRLMPIPATFIVGWSQIAGVPPFRFWSKDEIPAYAYDVNPVLWVIGLLTALLTAFYMSRQVFMTFFGEYRYADVRPEEISEIWDNRVATAEAAVAEADRHRHRRRGRREGPGEARQGRREARTARSRAGRGRRVRRQGRRQGHQEPREGQGRRRQGPGAVDESVSVDAARAEVDTARAHVETVLAAAASAAMTSRGSATTICPQPSRNVVNSIPTSRRGR